MAIVFVFGSDSFRIIQASSLPADCFSAESYMRNAFVRDELEGVTQCAIGWLDIELIRAYRRCCMLIGRRIEVCGGFRPHSGSRIAPCHVGRRLILGAHMEPAPRERLRTELMRTGVFSHISTALESPDGIMASIAVPRLPPVVDVGAIGGYAALAKSLLLQNGMGGITLDCRFDPFAANAAARFCRKKGLPPRELVDIEVWSALLSPSK